MHDIILFLATIAYMIGGYFVVDRIDRFLDNNYTRDYNNENEESDK